jgi:hypothetical protein
MNNEQRTDGENVMNKIKTIALGVFILALLACEQPFKAGLGPIVDIRPPTVTLTSPGAGNFIWSNKAIFRGDAEDDYKLIKVELRVTNHPDINYYRDFTEVKLALSRPNEGTWVCEFDTTIFPDGDLKIQVKVTDSVTKSAVTGEIAFYIKNQPPAISVSSPFITRVEPDKVSAKPGEVGGPHLNYYVDDNGVGMDPSVLPPTISYQRRVDKGSFLSGSISDDEDIYVGEEIGDRYPPQIRLWRVDRPENVDNVTIFAPGDLPPVDKVPWDSFKMTGEDANLFALGIGNYQFAYSLPPDESGCFYGFEIRAQGINDENRTQLHYPRDYYPSGTDWDNLNNISTEEKWFRQENRYVLLYIITPQAIPTVDLIHMEDVLNPGSWNGTGYENIKVDNKELEEPHDYVDKYTANKNGSFILRVRADHPETVESAEVYWEKEDGTQRGRFIWDLADASPSGAINWDPENNVKADSPYSHWGYRDQNVYIDGFHTTRNYIYTYNHGGDNTLPNTDSIHSQVRGKSKIQRYTGDADWQSGKRGGLWSSAPVMSDSWTEISELEEGVYNIEVYARSKSGTPMTTPFTCTIRLDRSSPVAEIINIDGIDSQYLSLPESALVNGVIEVRMLFSDSLAVDTGLRSVKVTNRDKDYMPEDYYLRPESTEDNPLYGYEQRYILVNEGDRNAMDVLIAYNTNWWPNLPETRGGPLVLEGTGGTVTAVKHGPIFNSRFKFKTSSIYAFGDPDENGALDDGVYYLYVFARDNAFNVGGIAPCRIEVDKNTDLPRFDFSIGEFVPTVKNASYNDQTAADGFWPSSGLQNLLRSGSSRSIQIGISDDDSLDLGTAVANSAIEISFTGSKSDEDGNVTPQKTIHFSPEQVKRTFDVQETDANGRKPAHSRKLEISQSTLLNLLQADAHIDDYRYLFNNEPDINVIKANYPSLPDGIYQIAITIKDYSDGIRSKLKMEADDPNPDVAQASEYFWFAIDSTPPSIISEVFPTTNRFYSHTDLAAGVRATISERNGPITVTYTVTDGDGNILYNEAPAGWDDDYTPGLGEGILEKRFIAPIVIPDEDSGTYNVTLWVRDRFNNTTTINQRYMIDTQPPELSLRTPIATVDRSVFDDVLLDANGLIEDNKGNTIGAGLKILANGVVRFQLNATDNFTVTQVRWFLFPTRTSPPYFTSTNSSANPEKKTDWELYFNEDGTHKSTNPANSDCRSLTGGFSTWQYVNTKLLDDGAYTLYAMALDNSGNYSAPVFLQDIYVAQNSDIPFFGEISPSGVGTVAGSAVIQGTIYEDDGFQNADGTIRNGSIRIWVSDDEAGRKIDTTNINNNLNAVTPSFTGFTSPETITNGLSRSGKDINLNVDLKTTNANAFGTLFERDGVKHYIIEATDSAQEKYNADGTKAPATETKTRRFYYSFTYDVNPPTIGITLPEDNESYSPATIEKFELIAWMNDANLDQVPVPVSSNNYYYYFDFRLNTGEKIRYILNHAGDVVEEDGDTVKFTIPPANIVANILTGIIPSGDSTLYLTAYDKTGKEATTLLKFIMDMTGPDVFLNETEVKLEDVNEDFNWWPTLRNNAYYRNRRNLLLDKNVPVIQRKSPDTFLTGTFVDEIAAIRTDFEYLFDDTGVRTLPETPPTWETGTAVPNGEKSATWSVKISDLSDGLHSIKLRAYDANNNATAEEKIKMFAFRISGEQPTVKITHYDQGDQAVATLPELPTAPVIIGNETGELNRVLFTVKGTAANPSLANVNLVIRHTESMKETTYKSFSDSLVPARSAGEISGRNMGAITNTWTFTASGTPVKVTENLEWSLKVTRDNLLVAGGITAPAVASDLAEGLYELALVSTDVYGLESEEAIWSFTVDRVSPAVTFTSTSQLTGGTLGDNANPYTPAVMNTPIEQKTLTMATPVIQARIQDNLSNLSAVQRQIRKWNYNNPVGVGRWEYFNFTSTGSWVAATSDACWQDAPYTSGMDSRLEWDLKATTGKTALVNLEDGFYSIRYRAKDSSTIADGTTAWTGTVNGNPSESEYLYFFYAFKTPLIEHDSDTKSFSSRNIIPLGITATDDNRFNTLTVEVQNASGTVLTATTVTATLTGAVAQSTRTNTWSPGVNINFIARGEQDDGSYRVVYTVTDMAGRWARATRVIALDNTPPEGDIYEPRLVGPIEVSSLHSYPDASEIKIGGEELTMNGTASDLNDVAEIWFHLGYGYNVTNKNTYIGGTGGTTGNPAIVPFPSENLVKGYFTNGDTKGSAPDAGSAWFQYKNGAVPLPNFKPITSASGSLLSWELEMDNEAIGNYAKQLSVTVGTTTTPTYYAPENATGPWMVQPIHPDLLEQKERSGGLYSLPLWVRIVDGVGNVYYTCRDIWIYPNGDYPSGMITNPSNDTNQNSPRGGVISFDGSANDNRSVRKVIYRVKADGYTGDGWASRDAATIVTLNNAALLADDPQWSDIRDIFATAENGGTTASPVGGGWYVVDLGARAGSQSVPWDFTINADDEIKRLIPSLGFSSRNDSVIDMIRVRVELYVFDDNDQSPYRYNKVSLGLRDQGGGEPGSAKPYVRVFYLKDSAPIINDYKISKLGSNAITADDVYSPTTKEVRGGKFAIQAHLDGNGAIGQISVRLRGETNLSVTGATEINRRWVNVTNGSLPGISITSINANNATLTWKFDTAASAPDGWHVHKGDWSDEGGSYTIDVRVTDTSNPAGEASFTFELGVDNFAPLADNRSISKTSSKVAGTNVSFIGRVFDYYTTGTQNIVTPTNRGIDKVYAWFTKDQSGTSGYINMNTKMLPQAQTAINGTSTISAWRNRTATVNPATGDTVTSITLLPANVGNLDTITYPAPPSTGSTAYLKVLSADESGIMTNQITWQTTTVAGMDHDVLWNFITDTTVMPDGKMYLNYLVIDQVGNASYYQQEMVVMNNYPQITNITLRTNNMGIGAIFTTHDGDVAENSYTISPIPIAAGYLNSDFISKNQGIAFGVETLNGNEDLNYRVQYVERVEIPLTTANLRAMATKPYPPAGISVTDTGGVAKTVTSSLYTIANRGGVTDYEWKQLGVPEIVERPPAGTHFVFQGAAPALGTPDTSGIVWGYRVITTTASATPPIPSVTIQTPVVTQDNDKNVSTTDPDSSKRLGFEGSNYFGDTNNRIAEDLNGTNNYFFLIKVWDSVTPLAPSATPPITEDDMLYDAVVVKMKVYLSDKTEPTARLYDLNPYTETAVTGNNIGTDNQNTTIEVAADPTGIGSNILRGGLFNVKTERDLVKSGYIDPRSGTTALNVSILSIQNEDTPNESLEWSIGTATAPNRPDNFVTGDTASATRDRVSGRVILRGYAWDDQFVQEIRIKIGDDSDVPRATGDKTTAGIGKPILRLTPVDKDGNEVPENVAVGRKMLPVNNEPAFAFEKLHWKNGHMVEWAYVWDTEKYPASAGGVYKDNVTITVQVIDRNGITDPDGTPTNGLLNVPATTDNTTTRVFHNQIAVDIVPYVVGFERQSIYANTRSRQGWYSFFQGETGIALLGYNLGQGTTATAPAIKYATVAGDGAGTDMSSIVGSDINDQSRFPFFRRYTFTVPDTAVSSKINVTAKGAIGVTPTTREAYNHGSTSTSSWNKENYTTGRELWNNKPHAHVWRTTQGGTAATGYTYFAQTSGTNDTIGMSIPSMALEYYTGTTANSGRLTGVYASYGNDRSYYAYNDDGARRREFQLTAAQGGEPLLAHDVSFYNGGGPAAGTLVASGETDGTPQLIMHDAGTTFDATNRIIGPNEAGRPTQRWMNSRVARANGRSYITSYDSYSRGLFFDQVTINGNNVAQIQVSIDGGNENTGTVNNITTATGNIDRSTIAGEYSAVDYDGYGPIVAYYDQSNDTLRIAYAQANNAAIVAGTTWVRQYVIPSTTHELYRGSGKHVSIKVDRGNNVHLAFYNQTKDAMVYAYASARNSNTELLSFTAANIYIVDNVVKGGTRADISVDNNGNPWIVYGDTTRLDNYDGVRMAYRSNGAGGTSGVSFGAAGTDNRYMDAWEAVSMPANYKINNDRLNIEAWPPTNRAGVNTLPTASPIGGWHAAIGYASDRYRIGYFYLPVYKGY